MQDIIRAFEAVTFHISTASADEGGIYCVVNFGENTQAFSEEFSFDVYGLDFERIGLEGQHILSDNGAPFESVNECLEALDSAFSWAYEEGLISEEQIRSQIEYWPYGVSRNAL